MNDLNNMDFIHNNIRGNKTLSKLHEEIEQGVEEEREDERAITIRIPEREMEIIEKIGKLTNRSINNIINTYISECNGKLERKHSKILSNMKSK